MEPFHLVSLRFRVLRPVERLPHFHGPHWSALFRHLFHAHQGTEQHLGAATPSIWVQPIETGVLSYREGDCISLGLVVPEDSASAVAAVLDDFNAAKAGRGHFQPGVTVSLEGAVSRLTGEKWRPEDRPVSISDLEPEIERLCSLPGFTVETLSPLRIPRPAGKKEDSHRYCDAAYFLDGSHESPIKRLLEKVRQDGVAACVSNAEWDAKLEISGGSLTWLDVAYGDPKGKTVGGVAGVLEVAGTATRRQAESLVAGQYAGVGKNGAFGLGFYRIPELDGFHRVAPLARSTSIFGRAVTMEALSEAVGRLADSSPGNDGMTLQDAKKAGLPFLHALRESAVAETVAEISLKRFNLPKHDGSYRPVYVQNVGERVIHRAFADGIGPSLDGILSSSAYAYRRGLSRKNAAAALRGLLAQGYCWGLKADIAAFFDSVDTEDLSRLLRGLFPAEPMVAHISSWLARARDNGISGLPQGWALSPALSNLYLDRFDRAMEDAGLRLVRFADDFVALSRDAGSAKSGIKKLEAALARLGLRLKAEKSQSVVQGRPIDFLGYVVSAEGVRSAERPDEPPEEEWLPVFRADWQHGMPVYLTSSCHGAYSSGPHLVVKHADDSSETIPWSRIARLVVVGRSPFSGGVVYRAVREQIPVTFIDVMGRTCGNLTASGHERADLRKEQAAKFREAEWQLGFARQVVAAKINNSFVLLRRNKVAAPALRELEQKAAQAGDLETLRGLEGAAARLYFEHFAALAAPFEFKGRCYRPPDGPVNVMLSFGYTLLYNRLASVLREKGFNAREGVLHVGRGTHCALASDLMEPLRHIVDRIVLSLIHLKELSAENFECRDRGGAACSRMDGNGFRAFINRYEYTMASRFTPARGAKMSYNEWLDETVDGLARAVKFGLEYQPLRID